MHLLLFFLSIITREQGLAKGPVPGFERGMVHMRARYFPITCIYPRDRGVNIVPMICISGKFLEAAGFITGDEVSVKVRKPGELVVTIIPAVSEQKEEKYIH